MEFRRVIFRSADAAYGNDHGFREGLEALGFSYAVGIQSSTSVWPPGSAPLPAEEVPRAPVLADAAYGNDHGFREGLEALGFSYAVGIQSSTSVWPPGSAPLPAKARGVMGRPPKLLQRDEKYPPLSVKELALCLSPSDLRRVSWREGTRGTMASRFAALRVRVAHR